MKNLIGKKAADFSLPDQYGMEHTLSDYKGKIVILYFYPKDMTPGCTVEAQGFRDISGVLRKYDAQVIGISADSVSSHEKFCDAHDLNFPLLSDEKHEVLEMYGAWVEKSMFGKKYMGIERSSVLIDGNGYVYKQYEKVNPNKHPQEALEDVKKLHAEVE